MDKAAILSEKKDGILTLTFNRPEKKNALSETMYRVLYESLDAAQVDPEVRVVLIRGQESAFSAGNDLSNFSQRVPGERSGGFLLLEALHRFEKPVVAAVSGISVGVGATMLLHCDLVYVAPNTRFRLPFVNLGVVPEGASSLLLPLRIGHQRAAPLLMLGDFFNTQQAIEAGMASEEIPLETLFDHAYATAERLASMPQEPLIATKRLMKRDLRDKVSDTITHEEQMFSTLLHSPNSKKMRGES